MTEHLLGYNERPVEVDGEYDYNKRSYIFDPIYEARRGFLVTQAMMMCRECGHVIKSTGGPGYRSVCLNCYPVLKLADFAQGHQHNVTE